MSPSVFKRLLLTFLSLFLLTALAGCSYSDNAGASDDTTGGTLSSSSDGAPTSTAGVKTVLNEVDLSANKGDELKYSIEVPEGTSKLNILMSDVTGDPDMYVRHGAEPTEENYDCRPYKGDDKDELCDINNPQTGTWHVKIHAFTDFSGVDLKGDSVVADTVASNDGSVNTMGMPPSDNNPGNDQGSTSANNNDSSSSNDSGANTGENSNDTSGGDTSDTSGGSSTTDNGNTGSSGSNTGGGVTSSGGGTENDASPTLGLGQSVYSDLRRTKVNETITFPVLGSDIDTAGAITVTQQPANGTLSVGGKQLTFTPNNGVSGYSVAKIKVDWLDGSSDTATIELYTEQVGKETQFDSASGVQAAINNAQAGDRIYLKGGQTYNLGLTIDDIGGTIEAPIVLSSYGSGKAKIKNGGNSNAISFGGNIGRFILENVEVTSNAETGIRAYNAGSDFMNVLLDNVSLTGSAEHGMSWTLNGGGSMTIINSNISDNEDIGVFASQGDFLLLNNTILRNHDTKDYSGGPMRWGVYTEHSDSLRIEGNTIEDSEGLMKLRAPKNFTVQKNTFRRGWVVGLSGGGQTGATLENGLIAYNLIEDSGNGMDFGDSDGSAGGGIANVDVRDNVVIGGHYSAGFTNGGTMSVLDSGDSNSNFRIFDNIFWASESLGFGGAYVAHSDVEFYSNIIGGGHASTDWQNFVVNTSGFTPNMYDNTLYKFQSDTDLGISLSNGNTEATTIPQQAQSVLDRL